MGKRRTENDEENARKKSRNRIIIYSSDEESSCSTPDPEPVPGPSRDIVATSDPPRAQPVSTPESATDLIPEATSENMETTQYTEVDLDEDLLVLLGEAPEPETTLGKAIHKDIASRWLEVLKKGLSKELKEKLEKEYLIPNNCELLVPPLLNPEAKAALTDMFVRRDASLMYRQKQTSNAVAALAQAIEVIISNKFDQEIKQKILKPVNDACRILCDMHHGETIRRRKFVISSINTGMKETLTSSGTDKYLFGDNMSEKLKAAKTVQRSGDTLKVTQKSVFHKSNFYNKNTSNKNRSNFKPLHQKTAGRQDAGRAPAAPRFQNNSWQSRAQDRAQRGRSRSPPPPAPPRPPRRYNRR